MDLAASIQAVTEDVMLRLAARAFERTRKRRLCLAGGVALNCVANGRILREGPFDEIWIQPAAGDAGGALGAALLAWHHALGRARTVNRHDGMSGAFLGPQFSATEIEAFLEGAGENPVRLSDSDLVDRVASLVDSGKVVGWFQGRMEFGPRALGARSIIGDARNPAMQEVMNKKIKFRESFRPFAPSVLREHAGEYFDLADESPYMLLVAQIAERRRLRATLDERSLWGVERLKVPRSVIPAVTHIDHSARVQTVDGVRHGRFHALLQRFYDVTGCPVIVNTSFNVRGEPIVCTPADAYRCFLNTHIDALAIGNCLLTKDGSHRHDSREAAEYLATFQLD
jgi:carbamoyltransferase